jgi:hypothetical protein
MAANEKGGTSGEPRVSGSNLDREESERLAALFKPSWETVAPSRGEHGEMESPPSGEPIARVRQATLKGMAPVAMSPGMAQAPPPEQSASTAAVKEPRPEPAPQHAEYTPPTPPAVKTPQADAPVQSVEVHEEARDAQVEAAPTAETESSAKIPTIVPRGRDSGRLPHGVVQLTRRDLILIAVVVLALLPIFVVGLRTVLAPPPTTRVVYETVAAAPQATSTQGGQPVQNSVPQRPPAQAPATTGQEHPSTPSVDVRALPTVDELPAATQTASIQPKQSATKPASKKQSTSRGSSAGSPAHGESIVRESPF